MPYSRAKVNSYFLETTLRVTSFFEFFLSAHRAHIKKVVRATALRERDNDEPRDGAAAARRLARITTQPSCEFVWFGRARFA